MGKRNTPPTPTTPPRIRQTKQLLQYNKDDAAGIVRRLNHRLQGLPALSSRLERMAHGGGAAIQSKKDVNAAKRLHDLRTKLQPDL